MRRGEIFLMPFPFTDLKHAKVRPVVVLALLPDDDCVACMMTTRPARSAHAIPVLPSDVFDGRIRPGHIRPERLVTCARRVLLEKLDELRPDKLTQALRAAQRLFD